MSDTKPTVWDRLKEPFKDDEIEWRVQQCGKRKVGGVYAILVPYVTARAIMDRLDDVVGPNGWTDTYNLINTGKEAGFLCTLGVRVPISDDLPFESNGMQWIYRQDGAPTTNIEAIKGGISDALKRAAVKFGMGRYLYHLDTFFANNPVVLAQGEYPPRNERTISIVKKDEFRAWCYPPSLNGKPAKRPELKPPARGTQDATQDTAEKHDKLVARAYTGEKKVYEVEVAWRSARKKYLDGLDPKDATTEALEGYLAHMTVKWKEQEAKQQKPPTRSDTVKAISDTELELVRADIRYPMPSPGTQAAMSDAKLAEHLDRLRRILAKEEVYEAA